MDFDQFWQDFKAELFKREKDTDPKGVHMEFLKIYMEKWAEIYLA